MTPAPLVFELLGRRADLVDLSPVGLAFRAGEQLRLLVSAQNLFGTMMPGNREYTPRNSGQHVVHTGGSRASYLQLPVKAV